MKLYGPAVLLRGDCVELLPRLAAAGFRAHAVVSDPPYGLEFLGHKWDGAVAHREATWRAIASVLLPGAHVVAMSHDSTYHRLGCAMEAAGILPRHMIAWLYATGRCQAQRVAGGDPEHEGLAPRLAPGVEPIYLGRLSLEAGCSVAENLRRHGVGALRVEALRSPVSDADREALEKAGGWTKADYPRSGFSGDLPATTGEGYAEGGRYPKNVVHDGSPEVEEVFGRNGPRRNGARTAGVAGKVYESPSYRGVAKRSYPETVPYSIGSASRFFPSIPRDGDSFAFEPKPKGSAREESGGHPTPKSLPLTRWLTRLVTCFEGQVVVDPFLGSGTTMRAALDERMRCVGVELDEVSAGGRTVCPGYCATILRRCPEVLEHVLARAAAELKLRLAVSEESGLAIVALDDGWRDSEDRLLTADEIAAQGYDPEVQVGALVVLREPAGEATSADPLGRALGLTLPEHRVPLSKTWLEIDLAPDAPADLEARLAELATWPEVQALLCRRGDLLEGES